MRPFYEYDTDEYVDPDAQQDAADDFYNMEVCS